MALAKYVKTPVERKSYQIDYSAWLGDTEEIDGSIFTVTQDGTDTPVTPLIVDARSTAPDGKSIIYFVSGGDAGESYTIDVQATTSTGQTKEDQIKFFVRSPNSYPV